jgi:hypothetical protein
LAEFGRGEERSLVEARTLSEAWQRGGANWSLDVLSGACPLLGIWTMRICMDILDIYGYLWISMYLQGNISD